VEEAASRWRRRRRGSADSLTRARRRRWRRGAVDSLMSAGRRRQRRGATDSPTRAGRRRRWRAARRRSGSKPSRLSLPNQQRRAPPSTVVAHVPYGSSSTLPRRTSLASLPPSETSGIPLSVLLTAPSCTPLWVRLPCFCSAVLVSGIWGHIPADYLHGRTQRCCAGTPRASSPPTSPDIAAAKVPNKVAIGHQLCIPVPCS
jgi:hypothetical protein